MISVNYDRLINRTWQLHTKKLLNRNLLSVSLVKLLSRIVVTLELLDYSIVGSSYPYKSFKVNNTKHSSYIMWLFTAYRQGYLLTSDLPYWSTGALHIVLQGTVLNKCEMWCWNKSILRNWIEDCKFAKFIGLRLLLCVTQTKYLLSSSF